MRSLELHALGFDAGCTDPRPQVLNAERQRIKVIRDRHVNDSKTFGDVLLSALFAFFTFLGNFLYDVSTLRAWADDKYGSGY